MRKKAAPPKKGAARQSREAAQAAPEADKDTKHPGGRPSKYDPKYCEEMLAYFDPEKNLAIINTSKDGAPILAAFPLMAGFAWRIGVHRDTLDEWRKRYPEFSDAYARAREAQEVILASGGLRGAYNATFATLTAKNILGWRDRVDTEHSTKPGDPIAMLMAEVALGARLKPA